MKNCIYCNNPMADDAAFCPQCGQKQEIVENMRVANQCPQCKAEVAVGCQFCPVCGAQLQATALVAVPKNLKEICRLILDPNVQNKGNILTWALFKRQFVSFEGRLNREDYIYKNIFLMVVTFIILAIVDEFVDEYYMGALDYAICFLACVVILLNIVANCSLNIRRLHDLNLSGWWALLLGVPVLNGLLCLYLVFVKGTNGANNYGKDLLAGE
ncbi:MAG: zinc-ribbon domain-containing protein [Phascolarctobacterium sp.]|uniref:zinc-ribbon domain-containing protein n=1 Tax=Phascolarctobacterium sp. TaxID=2049039 RepID=UPI0026DD9261|nr:zinc-ribbon domain-containing protein [Phascolarctobacterium sp.]MDO4921763.1 zinc-ribbon domain-containing protein [Phascolarctobacterium sp.]